MSGGFFRGTSAEQDTRFSNKQAKLLKTQKFAPELEHPVDMTKVKIDVMKPWIATRVTELIGFEDEVLINFIYGLLDNKVVNGKEVQISLTGFMERNTGKFMKELWSLLLSAQQNASGVPQQFLDAKEEETRKKKAETDRIANEIQRKREKEKREKEEGINNKMDGDVDNKRDNDASMELENHQPRASSIRLMDEKEPYERSASRGRSSERRRSRSMSRSPHSRGRSKSISRSPPRRSISPPQRRSPRRYLSPPRCRSSHSRRRSISPVRHRSPSPARYRIRSPLRRRSRSPVRRRTRSPIQRRSSSLSGTRSQSPVRHRSSMVRRRSRSPIRRRSPVSYRRRSPSPSRGRYRRSPSTPRHRSPSPVRRRSLISGRRRLISPVRHRSPSPQDWSSPSAVRRSSPSPSWRISSRGKRMPAHSPDERIRSRGKYSPTQYSSPSEDVDSRANTYKVYNIVRHRSPDSLRSPQRERHHIGSCREVSATPPSPRRSRSVSESPPIARKRSPSEERSRGSYENYLNCKKDKMIHSESFSPLPKARRERSCPENSDTSNDGVETKYSSERPGKTDVAKNLDRRESGATRKGTSVSNWENKPSDEDGDRAHERSQSLENDIKGQHRDLDSLPKLPRRVMQSDLSGLVGSGSEESDKCGAKSKNRRKHRRPEREEIASDNGSISDSHAEGRMEAKRRRKDEKRLKKEERRRRREERRRRREERRAGKQKLKSTEASIHSDIEKNDDGHSSDVEYVRKLDTRGRDIEEMESEQKKLEISLREKALESLRAKKGIGH